jgi:hypothetical protein
MNGHEMEQNVYISGQNDGWNKQGTEKKTNQKGHEFIKMGSYKHKGAFFNDEFHFLRFQEARTTRHVIPPLV